jgi:hypothetical protein
MKLLAASGIVRESDGHLFIAENALDQFKRRSSI